MVLALQKELNFLSQRLVESHSALQPRGSKSSHMTLASLKDHYLANSIVALIINELGVSILRLLAKLAIIIAFQFFSRQRKVTACLVCIHNILILHGNRISLSGIFLLWWGSTTLVIAASLGSYEA